MNRFPTIEGVTVYVVISLRSRKVLYKGQSSYETAEHSERGTCFGWGNDEKAAFLMATQIADRCQENKQRQREERRAAEAEAPQENVA